MMGLPFYAPLGSPPSTSDEVGSETGSILGREHGVAPRSTD
jgi:hypothetical protein